MRDHLGSLPSRVWLFAVLVFVPLVMLGQAPTYQILVPPSGIASNAGEPSIGVNWNTGKIMFQAVLETDQVTVSGGNPATATWVQVSPMITSLVTLDPILFTDHTTGRTFISELAGACSLSAFSD